MREEDEIRAAVVALMEAQEAGEDVSAELPSEEALAAALGASPEAADGEELDPEVARERAIAGALDYVRAATRQSRLAVPSEWAEAGLVPPSLTPEDLEMAVYDVLMEYGDPLGVEGAGEADPSGASAAEGGRKPGSAGGPHRPANRHVKSAFSSSNGRPVGAMGFKAHKDAREDIAGKDPAGNAGAGGDVAGKDPAGNAGAGGDVAGTDPVGGDLGRPSPREVDPLWEGGPRPAPTEDIPEPTEAPESVDVSESMEVPEPTDAPEVSPLAAACVGIRLLMGAESYYLYDSAVMTGTYARWAFLAAEDDPVATFIECVREESQVYPRPMARSNLANAPFRMGAEAVEAAYASAREQGRADDIERVEASNGDVYFYSTAYLSPRRAQALAEWDAVERIRNV